MAAVDKRISLVRNLKLYYNYIKIIENYFESAISDFKIGLLFNDYSYDLNYNIAFAYEAIRDYKKAYWYYNKIKNFYDNNKLNKEIHEKLKSLNDYLRLLEIDKIEAKSKSYQQITTLEEMICTLQKSNEKLKDKLSHKNQPRNKGKFTKK